MKRTIYKIMYIFLLAFIIMMCKNIKVQAASASLTATTTEPQEGQSVTVTANVTAGAWNLQFAGNGKSETIYGYTQANANASDSKTITFTAGSAGTKYQFTLTGDMTDITADNSEPVNKSITITVKAPEPEPKPDTKPDPEPTTPPTTGGNTQTETPPATTVKKSAEARLKNFGIEPNDFSGFKKDKYEYGATVPNNVSEVDVYAEPVDGKATITGTGKVSLKEGKNTVEVKVTAEDGKTTKTYKLTINRRTAEEENVVQSEARLSNLGIRPEEYDFEGFNKDKTEYSVQIPSDVKEIEVYAEAVNSNCQITGIGMITLEEGDNTLTIDVISENGTQKTYTIKVTRTAIKIDKEPEEEKFGLSDLSILGLKLTPKFEGQTYEYKVDLTEDLSELEILTEKTDKDATIEIIGNENLKDGENVITILVKNEETEEVATYQIIVNKVIAKEEIVMSWLKPSTWGKEEYIKITLIIVLIILIISAIILKIQIRKENNKSHEIDFPGAEALDKAIAEHQELAEEESVETVTEKHSEHFEFEKSNYLEDIAKQRVEQNENSSVYEDDFAPTIRRRRRRD